MSVILTLLLPGLAHIGQEERKASRIASCFPMILRWLVPRIRCSVGEQDWVIPFPSKLGGLFGFDISTNLSSNLNGERVHTHSVTLPKRAKGQYQPPKMSTGSSQGGFIPLNGEPHEGAVQDCGVVP